MNGTVGDNQILHGDALEILRTLPDNSVDAIVSDPPSGISFMSKSWDSDKGGRDSWIAWLASIMGEAYRVLKPGGHGLIWALPRTSHWTALALEDAGFEIRDSVYHLYSKSEMYQDFLSSLDDKQQLMFERLIEQDPMVLHIFGSGFPKSMSIDKAIDKHFQAEREVIGISPNSRFVSNKMYANGHGLRGSENYQGDLITAPATPAAQQFAGFGSALKPAVEVWWLIRKPLSEKSIAANVLKWGTGGLNIDGCRIPANDDLGRNNKQGDNGWKNSSGGPNRATYDPIAASARFPSHLLLSHSLWCSPEQCAEECPVRVMDEQSGVRKCGARINLPGNAVSDGVVYRKNNRTKFSEYDASEGGASRYFARFYYTSKASRRDRSSDGTVENTHPTCKSTELMKYLIRLVCPPDGIVLDPFAGSGTTGVACIQENKRFILIEREEEYIQIIHARIAHAYKQKEVIHANR